MEGSVARQVPRHLWETKPGIRAVVEQQVRSDVVASIVERLAPPVYEVREDQAATKETVSRAEALRLAQSYTKSLTDLASRLEAAGENYALADARRLVEAGKALVATLEGNAGRLPQRPGEDWSRA
ncbi:hypothetical protein [Streptomyces sp. NPDC102487]|uniref:hypothetical protein n=1 Tax=Streptomyces sp. NPDC102487 TaxID=3366182 RepID=UPI0037F1BB52